MYVEWQGFTEGSWTREVNVRDFIQKNYHPYEGNAEFLTVATPRTKQLWQKVLELMNLEREKGVLDVDTKLPTSITAHDAGYIDRELEQIVGLQTDKPLKRAIMPYGGIRVVKAGVEAYGYQLDPQTEETFTKYRKTHNDGVFDAYTSEMRKARKSGIITGLPDAYGRGRIIGDYRRVALYGVDRLMDDKKTQKESLELDVMDEETIRLREELSEQFRALLELKEMAAKYGCDIGHPAMTAKEAVQWLYFGYLGAVKEQNGAAMSLGRVSTFLDIYFERDLRNGAIAEVELQELIDHFVMKLRMVRFLRTPDYNALFSGDPTWVTEAIGGMSADGRTLVTKTSYRFLHTLSNLGAAPEPNLTVLWSEHLPDNFKQFCAKISSDTSSIQYENDDLMRPTYGDDYAIACCVSVMRIGKQMQFFGARVNLAKTLLYAINGGKDEKSGDQVAPNFAPITAEYLDYQEVNERLQQMMAWLAKLYINTLNVIHYMHDKYCYERIEMALHDRDVYRTMACGIAGLSVVVDSLSAIKYSKVKVIRNEQGLAVDYVTEGEYPKYGNNDDLVDNIAVDLVARFMNEIRKHPTYRHATPTQSVLTITSNVVYGKKTGNTPDGRRAGEPFAPGANPMHGRDSCGAISSLSSVAKLPYSDCQDGISNTFSIVPTALGRQESDRTNNLVNLLDGYFHDGGHHINVNALDRNTLLDAMEHPENYPQLTIRVSGYAVNFIKLTREQQLDVIKRTFHERV
ncbi:MAG: formate C-acetyltransferase [Pseudanabaena sp.]|jgi:formate C-acetyltransferase|nr:formate C-acetyltransferase [Pseudanabaena sp. M090S1SP2A07QC]MCA6506655.1 formate C-acetyltransferase [Pseudanabaena sp. M172S2SP2A07QC]MCA6509913.1 formate C-acetyltransferase [Pseudanabaena sp. M109S1SP2A07QC]MCA6519631.1 formate C-acetyltransferase [Pseudanabaena sp. M110S1SP2A07QC]MCA6524257.1 formate C-acetyltransferase [Pseudanabaena sp. M051S1SP2A07QC]MCA6524703.1 formate C-acetyltransferase [Pseudanabaena sp. M179S2SP2A07QC]MCA6532546.1 formate C-acetyltransferase [Pseudanabaena s